MFSEHRGWRMRFSDVNSSLFNTMTLILSRVRAFVSCWMIGNKCSGREIEHIHGNLRHYLCSDFVHKRRKSLNMWGTQIFLCRLLHFQLEWLSVWIAMSKFVLQTFHTRCQVICPRVSQASIAAARVQPQLPEHAAYVTKHSLRHNGNTCTAGAWCIIPNTSWLSHILKQVTQKFGQNNRGNFNFSIYFRIPRAYSGRQVDNFGYFYHELFLLQISWFIRESTLWLRPLYRGAIKAWCTRGRGSCVWSGGGR